MTGILRWPTRRMVAVTLAGLAGYGGGLAAQSAIASDRLAPQLLEGPLATRHDELNAA